MVPDFARTTEILAVADGAVASISCFRGHAIDGGGEVEFLVGAIGRLTDGVVVRDEFFDPGDADAMLARFEELRARRDDRTDAERAHAEHVGDAAFEAIAAAPRVSAAWVGPERAGQVAVLGDDGRIASVDAFSPGDERGMLERFPAAPGRG